MKVLTETELQTLANWYAETRRRSQITDAQINALVARYLTQHQETAKWQNKRNIRRDPRVSLG